MCKKNKNYYVGMDVAMSHINQSGKASWQMPATKVRRRISNNFSQRTPVLGFFPGNAPLVDVVQPCVRVLNLIHKKLCKVLYAAFLTNISYVCIADSYSMTSCIFSLIDGITNTMSYLGMVISRCTVGKEISCPATRDVLAPQRGANTIIVGGTPSLRQYLTIDYTYTYSKIYLTNVFTMVLLTPYLTTTNK